MSGHNGHRVKMHLGYDECECGQIIPRPEERTAPYRRALLVALAAAAVLFAARVAL